MEKKASTLIQTLRSDTATIHFSAGLTQESESDSSAEVDDKPATNSQLGKEKSSSIGQTEENRNIVSETSTESQDKSGISRKCSENCSNSSNCDSIKSFTKKSHNRQTETECRKVGDNKTQPAAAADSMLLKDTSVAQMGESTDSGFPQSPNMEQTSGSNQEQVNQSNKCSTDSNFNLDEGNHEHASEVEDIGTVKNSMTLNLNNSPSSQTTKAAVTSPTRFNPFNSKDEEEDEQDLFPQLRQNSEEPDDSLDDDFWLENDVTSTEKTKTDPELGITEDYFAQPEGHFSLSSVEELELAINACKKMVLEAPANDDHKKNLVHKLVQLRLKLSEAKEQPSEADDKMKHTVGHTFCVRDNKHSRRYCEHCNGVIWGVLQAWYRCDSCGFCCHEKCMDMVTRTCASIKVADQPQYTMNICPEKTLASQNYKCAECRTSISFHASQKEPRQCDYSGTYYCDRCHWNDLMIIPARILHNWDFEPKKVCRGTKQYLKLMNKRPVIRPQDVNPMLFNFVEELNEVKNLREEILIMKQYFLACSDALQSKLLLQLSHRQHFVENSDMYSLQDLKDIADDILLPELVKVHASFAQHIKTDCQHCQTKGCVCELCDEKEVLFPFDNIAIVCSKCSLVLHRHCFMRRNQKCPKCTPTSTLAT